MALQINPGIYNGGNVRLDSSPYMDFGIKMMAQKKAHDDAIDEYYKKLPGTVNETGMRDVDRAALNQARIQAQDFWQKNRDKLRNPKLDNGAAQLELENRYRQMSQLVEESKNRGKIGLELGKMRFDPEKAYIFEDPQIIETLHRHDLPIGVEGSEALNLSNMMIPPKPFEVDKYTKKFEKIPRDVEKVLNVVHDPATLKMQIQKQQSYGVPSLQAIYQTAATEYASNSSFRKFVKDTLDNESKLNELDPLFRKYFKNDSKDPRDGIKDWNDLAAIYTLQILNPSVTKTDYEDDDKAKLDYGHKLRTIEQGQSLANQKEFARYKRDELGIGKGDGSDEEGVWVDKYLNDLEDAGSRQLYLVGDYKGDGKEIAIDPVISKALTVDGQSPDKLIVTKDGSYLPVFYKRDNGKIVEADGYPSVNKTLSRPISRQQMKLALGVKATSAKQRDKEMRKNGGGNSKLETITW